MSLKIVLMLAFIAVVFALPEPKKSKIVPKADQEVKKNVVISDSDGLSDAVKDDSIYLSPEELKDEVENAPLRAKRACRSVKFRTKSGKVITIKKC